MAMNDEEGTGSALHCRRATRRQMPWRCRPGQYVGRSPRDAGIEEQGLGWKNTYGSGKAPHDQQGLEGAWTPTR